MTALGWALVGAAWLGAVCVWRAANRRGRAADAELDQRDRDVCRHAAQAHLARHRNVVDATGRFPLPGPERGEDQAMGRIE